MIRFVTYNEIDKKKWDECVHEAFNGIIYSYSWYLDIVCENWDALIENDYERILPLPSRRKWKINYLYQPVFTQQLGVISKTILTEEVVSSFLNAIPEKFSFAEINLNTLNKVGKGNYIAIQWKNIELDLINSYENLVKDYSANLKRNIKKARQSGLNISKNIKPDEIIDLFRKNRGKNIKNLKDEDYHKIKRLAYKGIYKGMILTYGVYSSHNELIAGAIFARSKKKMIFLFSGLSTEGKAQGAMAFLIDSMIRDYARQHITLDFEGSNDTNLARFYQSFGSTVCYYPHISFNRLPLLTRIAVQIAKRLRYFFI